MKIISKNDLEYKQLKNHKSGELYSFSNIVSDFFESRQVFLAHEIIAPGKRASSAHRHSYIEEIVFVSKGELTLFWDEQRLLVQEGAFIFFDPKDTELHCLVNESNHNVETVTFSIQRNEDLVIYQNGTVWTPPTLETSRLILRPIELNDAESIFSYAKNPNVCKFTLWETHQTIQDSLSYINDYILDYYSKGVPEPLGIALKENPRKIIGTVGCFWVSKTDKAMELAYAIAEEYWGRGLAVEASQMVIDYCFREFSLNRIQARCKVENKASMRVMEKIGMTYEGTLRSAIFHRDKLWDIHIYAKVIEQ